MSRSKAVLSLVLVWTLVALGCSASGNPVAPGAQPEFTDGNLATCGRGSSQTHLWGYYDVYIDIESQTATAAPNRQAMTTWNVVAFLNMNPASLGFVIHKTPVDPTGNWVDIDIDISITHPFPAMNHLNGYDVRGVFMGNASGALAYNSDLEYAVKGIDQFMLEDPDPQGPPWDLAGGGPDGYTRWFNRPEFITPGVLGYTPGAVVGGRYDGNATLNPYRYFADGLGPHDDLWGFLTATPDNGVFSAGTENTRNYYLRFPTPDPGIRLGLAILADWQGRYYHPANTPEAVGLSVTVTDDVYYVDETDNGGDLILDVSVFDWWGYQPSTIFIESTVLSSVYEFNAADMTPVGGSHLASTYHVEIRADNVTSTLGNEFWVIAEYDAFDYTNEFGVINEAWDDPLAAFFRYDLHVADQPYGGPSDWKNIPLREGFDAMDIAVDHADGDLLVLYSDGAVWRCTEEISYRDGSHFYSTYEPGMAFIDIAPNSCSVVGGFWLNQDDNCKTYNDNGNLISNGDIGSQCWAHDVIAFTGHTYTNMLGLTTFSCPMGTWFNWKLYEPPDYVVPIWAYLNVEGGCGPNAFHRDIIKGAECGNVSMWHVYYLEGAAPGCDEYRVQRVYRPSGDTLINDALSWGGARSDEMDGFWDPQDITRDIDNDFYILDILSTGEPLVKKYTEDGDPIGSFGDSTTIAGTPLRIEGSDYDGPHGNLMFVLHEGTPADMISVFFPEEIP